MNVVLVAAITTDGFIARHTNELADWTTKEDKQFFVRKTKELGVMVMGRTTFETIGRALPGRRMIVLSSDPSRYQIEDVEFTNEQPKELLDRLVVEGAKSVAVCGGAKVYTDFLEAKLIDEAALTIVDIKFEKGIGLVNKDLEFDLDFISSEYLSEKASVNTFRVK